MDMGIKDKSLTKTIFERLFISYLISMTNNMDLLKTDSLFDVRFVDFLKKFHVKTKRFECEQFI